MREGQTLKVPQGTGRISGRWVLIFAIILFGLLNVQSLKVLILGDSAVKVFHIFAVLGFPILLVRPQIVFTRIPVPVFLFSSVVIGVSILAPFLLQIFRVDLNLSGVLINPLLANYTFAFYLMSLGMAISDSQRRLLQVRSSLMWVSWLILLLVYAKILFFLNRIGDYLANPYAHPQLFWFYGGGPNLEATWMVMNGALLRGSRSFWAYWLFSFILAVIYASRVAIVLAMVLVMIELVTSGRRYLFPIATGLPLVLLLTFVVTNMFNPFAIERFLLVGKDVGSVTRLEMWLGSPAAVAAWPLGYGAGNAIAAVEEQSGMEFSENNVHNYFLQVLLDFGLFGFVAWLYVAYYILLHFRGLRSPDPFGTYMILYLVGGLVQFRGAEPLLWFIFGLFVASRRLEGHG